MGLTGNPWIPFLKNLRVPDHNPPKQPGDHQFYMAHEDYKQKVLDEYVANHGGTPANKLLKVQCQIAQTLLDGESEEVKERIKTEGTAHHERLLAAHNNAAEGLPPTTEEERQM
jgi:hypothetical protein